MYMYIYIGIYIYIYIHIGYLGPFGVFVCLGFRPWGLFHRVSGLGTVGLGLRVFQDLGVRV